MKKIKAVYQPNPVVLEKYHIGLEDGFALIADVVTNAHIFSDNTVRFEKDGKVVCPYIKQKRGRVFINEGDYIVFETDGSKHVVSEEKVWERFIET